LPPLVQLAITAYHLARCRCTRCGQPVRACHPAVAADQRGATAHRLGPRVLAAAHWLHYGLGIPVRKLPALLSSLTGVAVTQGALTQDALRRAAREVGEAYETLRQQVAQAAVAYTDDSSWTVGGESAFLMTFTTADTTVFQIRARHRNEEVREVLPSDYAGVMICDRARSYDARELQGVKQQKCLAHVLRSLTEALTDQWGRARHFPLRLQALLTEAIDLWRRSQAGEVTAPELAAARDRLQAAVTAHLRERRLTNATNRKLLSELGWHHDRGNLLRFLYEPGVEPTNNRAERALRPAVIARKVSHCSKNAAGATAHAAFTSVCVTLRQRGVASLVAALSTLFRMGTVAAPIDRRSAAIRTRFSRNASTPTRCDPLASLINYYDTNERMKTATMVLHVPDPERQARSRRVREQQLRAGEWPGPAPVGYRNGWDGQKGKVVIDEAIAPQIQDAFRLAARQGSSIRKVLVELTPRGLFSRFGKPMSVATLQRVLHNPFYAGLIAHEGQFITGKHQALVSKSLFRRVQRQLHRRIP
jgi:transposase